LTTYQREPGSLPTTSVVRWGLHLMRYICLPETHQRTTLKVESEKRQTERWQANTDQINQRTHSKRF
jgi:hypothetical protein